MEHQDNLFAVIRTLYRWRKTLRNVALIAFLLASGVSLLLDNYYKSTTVFYPASSHLTSAEMVFGTTGMQIDYFGNDRDLDRLTEIANSIEVIDFLIDRFCLFEHYKMDSTTAKGRHKMRERVARLYSAQQNKYDAIEISVEDTDPQQAADMANAARDKVAEIARRLAKQTQKELLETFEINLQSKQLELVAIGDSLQRLQSKFEIYQSEKTGEWFAEHFNKTRSEISKYRTSLEILEKSPFVRRDTIEFIRANLRAAEIELQHLTQPNGQLNRYTQGLPLLYIQQDKHFQARKQLTYDLERYNQIKAAYLAEVPFVHVVQVAEVPLVKSRPKRSLIILGAVVAATLFCALAALIADHFTTINWKKMLLDS